LCQAMIKNDRTGITCLDLSYNSLTDVSIETLSVLIKVATNASTCSIYYHPIIYYQSSHCVLDTLDLSYNDLGPRGTDSLSTALQVFMPYM